MTASCEVCPSDVPEQAPLAARGVALRVITPDDYQFLFLLSTSPELSHRWRYRGLTPSFQGFVENLFDSVLCQFIVEQNAQRIGRVVAYNADLNNGTVYCGEIVHPDVRKGLMSPGVIATFLFTNYLFHNWNLRKVYFDTIGVSINEFESALDKVLELEGVLKEHQFYGGRWWNRYFLTLDKSRWEEYVQPTVNRLTVR